MPDFPLLVTYGAATVKIYQRKAGGYQVAWRESGRERRSTRTTLAKAKAHAGSVARRLHAGLGGQVVSPGAAQLARRLIALAGSESAAFSALADLEEARQLLAGRPESLAAAVRHFVEARGACDPTRTLASALDAFRAKYSPTQERTRRAITSELHSFLSSPACPALLLDLDAPAVSAWCHRGSPAPRTLANRVQLWRTFLLWCQRSEWIPAGPTVAHRVEKPRLTSEGKAILDLDQAEALLRLVHEEHRDLLPYVLLSGWCGLRPSESQRLRWRHIDVPRGYIHLPLEVARKLQQERYASMRPRVADLLRSLRGPAEDLVAPPNAQAPLGEAARYNGIVSDWPNSLLRSTYCSYALAFTQNAAQVAEWTGHSVQVLRRNYRRPVPKPEGKRFFDLPGWL